MAWHGVVQYGMGWEQGIKNKTRDTDTTRPRPRANKQNKLTWTKEDKDQFNTRAQPGTFKGRAGNETQVIDMRKGMRGTRGT